MVNEQIIRLFYIFVVQGFVIVVFFMLTVLLMKPRRSNNKIILGGSFLFTCIGFILNMIYVFIFVETVVLVLYYITIICIYGASIFLMVFTLTYWKSEQIITQKLQISVILTLFGAFSLLIFIPSGVTINETTNWKPVWNLWLTLYISIFTLASLILSLLFIKKKIENLRSGYPSLKKGWTVFIIGVMIYGSGLHFIIIRFFIPEIIILSFIFNTIASTIGTIMIYYGLRHKFDP